MSLGQWVQTVDGWGEITQSSQSRFGSTSFHIIGDFGQGWYSNREIFSDIHDDEDSTTDLNWKHDTSEESTSTQTPDEAEKDDWITDGVRLPYDPEPTAEWDGQLTQQPDGADISLKPTNSLKGVDVHPDPENHNSIYANVGPRQAFKDYIAHLEANPLAREAAWEDVRRKAKRIYDEGDVTVLINDGREIRASVDGDHGRYSTEVHRKNAFGQGITWYDCNCEWGRWAYKRSRTFVGRLCSHGLAAYFAMQAGRQPTRDIKRIDGTTERHSLSGRQESLAARQGGLMVWDDDLKSVIKNLQTMNPAMEGNGPSNTSGVDPNNPDAGELPGPGNAADLQPNVVDNDFSGPGDNGTPPDSAGPADDPTMDSSHPDSLDAPAFSDPEAANNVVPPYVRTAEFERNPDPDNNFEDWDEDEDAEVFNDADELEDENDPEFAVYKEFWGRSSARPTTPVNPDFEAFDESQLRDQRKVFKNNGDKERARELSHALYVRNHPVKREAANHSDGDVDYSDSPKDHETSYQENPNDGVNGDSDDYADYDGNQHDDAYGDGTGELNDGPDDQDSDGVTWRRSSFEETLDDEDDFAMERSAAYANEQEADAFNDDSDDIVAQFQAKMGGMSFMDNQDGDEEFDFSRHAKVNPFAKTAGRHFTYAEQDELINEEGTADHLSSLNLENSFYKD